MRFSKYILRWERNKDPAHFHKKHQCLDGCVYSFYIIHRSTFTSIWLESQFKKKNESSEPYKLSHTLNSEKSKQFSLCDTDFTVKGEQWFLQIRTFHHNSKLHLKISSASWILIPIHSLTWSTLEVYWIHRQQAISFTSQPRVIYQCGNLSTGLKQVTSNWEL